MLWLELKPHSLDLSVDQFCSMLVVIRRARNRQQRHPPCWSCQSFRKVTTGGPDLVRFAYPASRTSVVESGTLRNLCSCHMRKVPAG